MRERIIILGLFLLMVWPTETWAGSFGKDDPSGVPGQWYVGEDPADIDENKAPIVFIHGLNSSSATWWNENDMYETAYTNGYQTAFIDLYPDKNMWSNGELLAEKLGEIYEHFGKKLVLAAHSKGGVDAQTALVYFGADEYVERVVTLSSPHLGSELADLAHSEGASWLADIIGNKNEATQSLQTGYMAYFRDMTDREPGIENTSMYTFGGTGWGPAWGSLFWGGLYLSQYGSNDGAVTVSSSRLPYAEEIMVDDWTHYTIKEGNATFNLFQPYLQTSSLPSNVQMESLSPHSAATFHSGGKFKRQKTETFHIEENVESVTIQWTSSSPTSDLTLYSPKGKQLENFRTSKDQSSYFHGAYNHTITLENPEHGLWRIQAHSADTEAYLLNVHFQSDINENINLEVSGRNNPQVRLLTGKDTVRNVRTTLTLGHESFKSPDKVKSSTIDMAADGTIFLRGMEKGFYNITAQVRGETQMGNKFNRSIVQTIYIDDKGNVYQR